MKIVKLLSSIVLLTVFMATLSLPGIALAQDDENKIEEEITLRPDFPTMEAIAGQDFEFHVEFLYVGEDSKVFDIRTTAPKGWEVYLTPRYEKERKITSINLKPAVGAGEDLRLVATAPFWPLPEPGDYKILVEAVSDTIQASTELTAKVTAKYVLTTISANDLYNTTARAGEDNIFSIKVRNLGTDAIDNIKFTPDNPEGWSVTFNPEKIDVLEAIDEQAVEMNIKPPPKTVAGDYMISLRASGAQATADDISIRVTVETPTIWGWVGVAIILIVVIGLIIIFMRFSRR
jgi:uncharacterized repeat protein (TIGR01451 family)